MPNPSGGGSRRETTVQSRNAEWLEIGARMPNRTKLWFDAADVGTEFGVPRLRGPEAGDRACLPCREPPEGGTPNREGGREGMKRDLPGAPTLSWGHAMQPGKKYWQGTGPNYGLTRPTTRQNIRAVLDSRETPLSLPTPAPARAPRIFATGPRAGRPAWRPTAQAQPWHSRQRPPGVGSRSGAPE